MQNLYSCVSCSGPQNFSLFPYHCLTPSNHVLLYASGQYRPSDPSPERRGTTISARYFRRAKANNNDRLGKDHRAPACVFDIADRSHCRCVGEMGWLGWEGKQTSS